MIKYIKFLVLQEKSLSCKRMKLEPVTVLLNKGLGSKLGHVLHFFCLHGFNVPVELKLLKFTHFWDFTEYAFDFLLGC